MKGIGYSIALLVLAGVEVACYLGLKQYGFSSSVAVAVTFGLCITLFVLGGCLVLSRSQPYGRAHHNYGGSMRSAPTTMYRQQTSVINRQEIDQSGYLQPVPRSLGSSTHIRSDAFKDELQASLEAQRDLFARLLGEADRELSKFDYSVLKTLERNSPGSIQGVLTAKKVYNALELRHKEIERFLRSLPISDPEKGRQLLLGDLEIPEDKQLTSVFRAPPIPPVKIAEIEFQMRVLLKRISRRRSIFRARSVDGDLLPEDDQLQGAEGGEEGFEHEPRAEQYADEAHFQDQEPGMSAEPHEAFEAEHEHADEPDAEVQEEALESDPAGAPEKA